MTADIQSITSAQRALDLNMKALRLEATDDKRTKFFHLLVSLIEWCDHHAIDFDESCSEVRQYFAETKSSV